MSSHLEFKSWVGFPIEKVFLFFADPANLPRLMPPITDTRIDTVRLVPPPVTSIQLTSEQQRSLAGIGSEIVTSFRVLPPLPLRGRWVAKITAFRWNEFFEDVQLQGPFKSWHHRHELVSEVREDKQGTLVIDKVAYAFGLGPFDPLIEALVSRQIEKIFTHRQWILPDLLMG
jgi:ligand-binding SRPBCC domain-containing protein